MRPGRSSASSSACGHVGGHHHEDAVLGRRLGPHAERPAHDAVDEAPGLLEAGQLGEQRLQRAHAAAALPMPPMMMPIARGPAVESPARRASSCARSSSDACRATGSAGRCTAVPAHGAGRSSAAAHRPAAAHGAAAAERVGLVEEHDHAAVAHRELAQLPEQRLDLEDADTHEHVGEGAGVDEHVGLARLARHRLGHQRLAGARRAPQQDAARARSRPCSSMTRGPRGRPCSP